MEWTSESIDGKFKLRPRHTVLTILSFTWIVSCMDRMAMSVALPYIAADYHLSAIESGVLISAFFAGYSISQTPGGLLADIFGVRRIATVALLWWSIFTAITGAAANLTQMLIVRFVFGLGEGVFPACAFKTITVWFPKEERATAGAIMLASNALGIALSPLVVVAIMSFWGWRCVFYSLFLPGFLIAVLFWRFVPNRPPESRHAVHEAAADLEHRDAVDVENAGVKEGLLGILKERYILRYFCAYFTFAIAIWGFTAWLPTYLVKVRGLSMIQMGVVASLPFLVGTIGSVLGGWMSDGTFRNNRRIPIVMAGLMSAFFLYVTFKAKTVTTLVICQTMAGFFLMFFVSSFWALPVNTVPKKLMGLASGAINTAGQIAAFISPLFLGYIVDATRGNYDIAFLFLIASLLVSSAIAFTLPSKILNHEKQGALG